ncbi:transcriptional regulator, TetR family [Klenkia brasiliensis]|uniref:Transcriptional regulator, TetR family n=1 Tax=Klenkia brasiliensis TaxID=333142 RepID=A0A1G7UVJ0_9ACTN|nr:transcriptional regulator, TetR family [Klenkia brasiliensis]
MPEVTDHSGRSTDQNGRYAATVVRVTRLQRQHADDAILDSAAGLFARHGFAGTSVQQVADAVGLSKAGLLHHFPSKDALHAAVTAQADRLADQVLAAGARLPEGPERDRATVEVLVDVALAHPGLVALMLSPTGAQPGPDCAVSAGDAAVRAFGLVPGEVPADPTRTVRVLGALGALAVLSLSAAELDAVTTWRPLVVATCLDALGHGRPGATDPTRSTDSEA